MADQDVFISYSHKDVEFIRALHEALTQRGRGVLIDWHIEPADDDWINTLYANIRAANAFVLVMTFDSLTSLYCNLEIAHAVLHHKRIIPIVRKKTSAEQLDSILAAVAAAETRLSKDSLVRRELVRLTENEDATMLALAATNWSALERHNWLSFTEADNFEQALEMLERAIETDISFLRQHTYYLNLAQDWDTQNRRSSQLLRGGALNDAEKWLASAPGKAEKPTTLMVDFIKTSRAATNRMLMLMFAAIAAVLVVLVGLGIAALVQADIAVQERQRALEAAAAAEISAEQARNNALLAVAQELFPRDPETALVLALEVNRADDPPPLAGEVLAKIAFAPGARLHEAFGSAVNALAVSPDGSKLAVGTAGQEVVVIDASTGTVERSLSGHSGAVNAVAFSPDGSVIASASEDQGIILWHSTGGIIDRLNGRGGSVNAVAFSPDGMTLLSGDSTGETILWDVQNGTVLHRLTGHDGAVNAVAFSPDGVWALSAGEDTDIVIWSAQTGEEIRRLEGHAAAVFDLAVSRSGGIAISSGDDSRAIVWNLADGSIARQFTEHITRVEAVAMSPDGGQVASADQSGNIFVWRPATGQITQRFSGHRGAIRTLAFSADGQRLYSGGVDDSMMVWDLESGVLAKRWNEPQVYVLNDSVAFRPDATDEVLIGGCTTGTFPLGCFDTGGSLVLWDLAAEQEIRALNDIDGETFGAVTAVASSPDGQLAAVSTLDGRLFLWNVETGAVAQRFDLGDAYAFSVDFDPSGGRLLASTCKESGFFNLCDNPGALRLFDISSGEQSLQIDLPAPATRVAFSPDGKRGLSGSWASGTLTVWNLDPDSPDYGKAQLELNGHDGLASGTFSPDGQYVLSGSIDRKVILWNAATGEIIHTLEGHSQPIERVGFSPDGLTALSASDDKQIVLWDVATGEPIRTLDGHGDPVIFAGFSPDGTRILSSDSSATHMLWRTGIGEDLVSWAEQNRYVPELSCQERERYGLGTEQPCGA